MRVVLPPSLLGRARRRQCQTAHLASNATACSAGASAATTARTCRPAVGEYFIDTILNQELWRTCRPAASRTIQRSPDIVAMLLEAGGRTRVRRQELASLASAPSRHSLDWEE